MPGRRIYDDELHAQFVTFSCYHRLVSRVGPTEPLLDYMHLNPVRAGLVEKAVDWAWSSARYFDSGKSVGVPLEWIFS